MSTRHPRLNVVLEPQLYHALNTLAHCQEISMSLLARDLLKEALELYEDIHWQQAVQVREKTFSYKKALPHKKIWK